MTAAAATSVYELRVGGHLDRHWCAWLGEDLDVEHHGDGTSTLTGRVTDQARLHGLLTGIRDIGAPLLSVCRIDMTDDSTTTTRATGVLERLDWPCRTERLSLRPGRPGDAAATWAYRRLDEVARWITAASPSFDAYRIQFEEADRLARTIVIELDGEVIGDLMLRVEDAWAQAEVADRGRGVQAELGWVLHPDRAGHGYATEAVRELLRLCFEDLGLRRVVANCFADNVASVRLMERLGMRREVYAVQESLHRSGKWLDTSGYALLADEWPSGAERPPPTR